MDSVHKARNLGNKKLSSPQALDDGDGAMRIFSPESCFFGRILKKHGQALQN